MTDRIQTHSEECWKWHLDCAVAKVERLTSKIVLYRFGKEGLVAEIERLTAENSRLKKSLDKSLEEWKAWMVSVDRGDYSGSTDDDWELFSEISTADDVHDPKWCDEPACEKCPTWGERGRAGTNDDPWHPDNRMNPPYDERGAQSTADDGHDANCATVKLADEATNKWWPVCDCSASTEHPNIGSKFNYDEIVKGEDE